MENNFTWKQKVILEATIKYISKHGLQAFSMRNIAEEVGIKQPTLYGHFKNKEEMLRGIFLIYQIEIKTYYRKLDTLNTTKLKKVRMFFKKMCEFIQYKPEYMNLVMLELYQYRELFKNELNFLIEEMDTVTANANEDTDLKSDIDYKWINSLLHGMLHTFLKKKLLDENYDVLTNADNCWNNLEKLIKN